MANKLKKAQYDKEWQKKNKDKVSIINRRHRESNKTDIKVRAVSNKLKHLYGLSQEQYNAMLSNQNDCCKICKSHYSLFNKKLSVDHCHETGKVRGLLCNSCNRGLGLLKDSVEVLKTAIDYLNQK